MYIYCTHCNTLTKNSKFCSRSCTVSHNNLSKKRPKNKCLICDNFVKNPRKTRKYCSYTCSGISRKKSEQEKKANNAHRQSEYRQKKYRQIHPTADSQLIKEFYINRPDGYEVDHIIPLSRGGLHHQDNLQYLRKEDNRKKGNKVVEGVGIEPTRPFGMRL